MHKILITILILLVGAGAVWMHRSHFPELDKKTIRIGVILPLTAYNYEVGRNVWDIILL